MAKVNLFDLPHWHQQLCIRLREVRKDNGFTMVQVVKMLGDANHRISQADLSNYERGKTLPSLVNIYALATAYDVDVYELLEPRNVLEGDAI